MTEYVTEQAALDTTISFFFLLDYINNGSVTDRTLRGNCIQHMGNVDGRRDSVSSVGVAFSRKAHALSQTERPLKGAPASRYDPFAKTRRSLYGRSDRRGDRPMGNGGTAAMFG